MKNIVDDFEDWWQPSVIQEAYDILPGILAVFLDRMCEIHSSSGSKLVPKVGIDGLVKNESKDLSWMDWELLIEDCDSLFFHIFSPYSELFAVLLKTVHKKARFCMFHVKKAWVDYCYNWFQKDRSVWAAIYKDMDDLAYAKTKLQQVGTAMKSFKIQKEISEQASECRSLFSSAIQSFSDLRGQFVGSILALEPSGETPSQKYPNSFAMGLSVLPEKSYQGRHCVEDQLNNNDLSCSHVDLPEVRSNIHQPTSHSHLP